MYAKGGAAVEPVGAAFPGVVVDGAISRPELGKYVINQVRAPPRAAPAAPAAASCARSAAFHAQRG
jgi:hypothetical protein